MSSAIRHLHYAPETRELSVWFGPEGRRYIYTGVPPDLYDAFRKAPSRGRFFNAAIRGRYACRLADASDMRNARWAAIAAAS